MGHDVKPLTFSPLSFLYEWTRRGTKRTHTTVREEKCTFSWLWGLALPHVIRLCLSHIIIKWTYKWTDSGSQWRHSVYWSSNLLFIHNIKRTCTVLVFLSSNYFGRIRNWKLANCTPLGDLWCRIPLYTTWRMPNNRPYLEEGESAFLELTELYAACIFTNAQTLFVYWIINFTPFSCNII